MCILTTCTTKNIHQTNRFCAINNSDHIKYLKHFDKNLSLLKIPKNLDITLPNISADYYIPLINLSNDHDDHKNNVQINIYPPMALEDISHESCLINID